MQIKVMLFAALRELADRSELVLDVAPGATVSSVRDALARQHPALAAHLARAAFAVNQSYVKADAPLGEGDELAVIPPVSGG